MFDYSFVLDVDNYSNRRLSKDKNVLNTVGERIFDLKRNKNLNGVFLYLKGIIRILKDNNMSLKER